MSGQISNLLPGPEVKGDPFWCLMEWKRNKLTGNFYASEPGFCLFFREKDAEYFHAQMPNSIKNDWVVRGIDSYLLRKILKNHEKNRNVFPPLLLAFPNSIGKQFALIRSDADEVRYYAKKKKFKDDDLNIALNKAIEIADNPPQDMVRRSLKFDQCFDAVLKISNNSNRPYPNLSETFDRYRKKFWDDFNNIDDELKSMNKYSAKDQMYTRQYTLFNIDYEITWAIPIINNLIDKYDLKPIDFDLDKIITLVDQSNIVESHLETVADSSEPVILVNYPLAIPDMTLIDGNHRVVAKYKNGIKTIKGYLIPPEIHMQGMILNIHRTAFKVHHNLGQIGLYLDNIKELNQLNLYDM